MSLSLAVFLELSYAELLFFVRTASITLRTPVPECDRGRRDAIHVLAVVTGFFMLGTRNGRTVGLIPAYVLENYFRF